MALKHVYGNATVAADADDGLHLFVESVTEFTERFVVAKSYDNLSQWIVTEMTGANTHCLTRKP